MADPQDRETMQALIQKMIVCNRHECAECPETGCDENPFDAASEFLEQRDAFSETRTPESMAWRSGPAKPDTDGDLP